MSAAARADIAAEAKRRCQVAADAMLDSDAGPAWDHHDNPQADADAAQTPWNIVPRNFHCQRLEASFEEPSEPLPEQMTPKRQRIDSPVKSPCRAVLVQLDQWCVCPPPPPPSLSHPVT